MFSRLVLSLGASVIASPGAAPQGRMLRSTADRVDAKNNTELGSDCDHSDKEWYWILTPKNANYRYASCYKDWNGVHVSIAKGTYDELIKYDGRNLKMCQKQQDYWLVPSDAPLKDTEGGMHYFSFQTGLFSRTRALSETLNFIGYDIQKTIGAAAYFDSCNIGWHMAFDKSLTPDKVKWCSNKVTTSSEITSEGWVLALVHKAPGCQDKHDCYPSYNKTIGPICEQKLLFSQCSCNEHQCPLCKA
jgi:hypothetical protein